MLVNCAVYQKGQKLSDIPVENIVHWLGRPDTFVWVALRDPPDEELLAMQARFKLHELAVEDARHGHQRPKIEEYDGMLFVVLHLPEYRDGALTIGEVDIFVGKDYLLSVRTRSEQQFLGVRQRTEREPHLLRHGPGYVFYALADAVVDRYFPVVDALDGRLEEIEAAMFANHAPRENIENLYALKHDVTQLRHAVAPLADAFGKLFGGRVPGVVADTQDYFRDVHDHLLRLGNALDTLRETLNTAVQVNLSMVTIEQSEVSKRLAAWAAIFAVLTTLAGIWGMNFEHMPELAWTFGYPAVLAIMAGAAFGLYRRFRKLGWL